MKRPGLPLSVLLYVLLWTIAKAQLEDTGDVIAKILASNRFDLSQQTAKAKKELDRLETINKLFNEGLSFTPPSSPQYTVTEKWVNESDGNTYAVFTSTSGNVYRYKVTDLHAEAGRRKLGLTVSLNTTDTGLLSTTAMTSGTGLAATAFVGPPQFNCAWQAYVTGRRFNAAYPDLSAVYQVLVQLNMRSTDVLRIKGTFPKARYFSVQSYNSQEGMPVSSIRDYEIVPDDGSLNPFNDTSASAGTGEYTIHLSLRKDSRFRNSLELCPSTTPARKCALVTALVIFRIYVADPSTPTADCFSDPPDTTNIPRLWGYQKAPQVSTTSTLTGRLVKPKNEWTFLWRDIPTCDPTRPTVVSNMLTSYINRLVPGFPPPSYANMQDNFYMYLGGETYSGGGVFPIANLDATYLVAVAYQQGLAQNSGRLVARIRGEWPKSPKSWTVEPKVPNWQDYDMRYASLSSVAFTTGGPTIDTINDVELEDFYSRSSTDNNTFHDSRRYSIVVGESRSQTCGLYNTSRDMFLSTTYNGKAQDYWGVIFRQLISKQQRDGLPDKSIGYARLNCAKDDPKKCNSPDVLRQTMGTEYPLINFYTCKNGVLTPITKSLQQYLAGSST